jgi:diguanylate cyclase (GGDEF)-like protein
MEKFFEEIKKFDICSGYLAEYNSEDRSFSVIEKYNYPDSIIGEKFIIGENELLKYIYNTGKHILINNASDKNIDLNFKRRNIDKFFISLLKSRTEILGFIKLDKETNYIFSDFEIKTIQMLLSKVAVLLENVKLYEKIKIQATEDGLTGLFNHLTFQEKLAQAFERKDKGEISCLSLALIDIDFFKKFNDSFGHQEGDRVLIKMANMLKEFSKENKNTWAARYGGEEFVFVMEDYDIRSAFELMDEIRKFSEANLKGGNDREQRAITLSIGVAAYPYYTKNARELIKVADDALYLAKQEGRNRVKSVVDLNKAQH